jgi:nucleoside-diphosphate-sugar epimerase
MEKIDYVHTRMSIPLAPDLSMGSYVAKTMKLISEKRAYTPPQNQALFDIISTDDVAHAYQLIGKFGLNTADYFIGTARPATLAEYFDCFTRYIHGEGKVTLDNKHQDEFKMFSTEELHRDTGFVPAVQFKDIIQLHKTP